MRYDLFQKVRKRQKEALGTKGVEGNQVESSPLRESLKPDNKENDLAAEGEMKDPTVQDFPTRTARLETSYSRGMTTKTMEDKRKIREEEPSDLVDTIRNASKSHRKGFLPIAMPSSRPVTSREGDNEYEYRSEFDAPDHIDVIQSCSYEDARTEVSEITGLTSGMTRQIASNRNGFHCTPRAHEQFSPLVQHVEEPIKVAEEQSRFRRYPRRIEVDVTDLDNIHKTARRARKELKSPTTRVETRYGLPYESTDFRADDDESEDSWGVAIVGNHDVIKGPSSPHAPIDVEKLMSESATSPLSHMTDVTDVVELRENRSKTEIGLLTPQSQVSGMKELIKETLSVEGEVIIDLSEILDAEDFNVIEVLRKSPRHKPLPPHTEPTEYPRVQPVPLSPVSVRSSRPPKTRRPKKAEPDAPTTNMKQQNSPLHNAAAPGQPLSPVQASMTHVQAQPSSPLHLSSNVMQTTKEIKSVAQANEMIAASMNYFKTLADGITSQLEKFDLLPESGMNNMLGVLDKDMKATSEIVPEGKEMVDFFGEQIKNTSCTADNTVTTSSPYEVQNLNFHSPSLDDMVDAVKTTYEKNLASCGGVHVWDVKPAQTPGPQTFIIPISLRGYDFDSEQVDHNSVSEQTTNEQ